MLFLVTGAPNATTLFAVETVRALAETAFGEVAYGHVSTSEQFIAAVRERHGKALILFLEAPERRIAELVGRSGHKVAMFEEGLESLTAFLMLQHRANFRSAVRYATLSASSLATLVGVCEVYRFPVPSRGSRLMSFIQAMMLFYGFQPETEWVETVARRLNVDELGARTGLMASIEARFPAAGGIHSLLDRLPPFERRILAELAFGYDGLAPSAPTSALCWPPGFCLSGDRPDEYLHNPVEMTGCARPVSYGPYLHLPAGEWDLEIAFEVSANHSGNRLDLLVTEGGVERSSDSFALPARAGVEARLPLRIEDPRAPVEIHVRVAEGAIEGELSLRSMRFERRSRDAGLLPPCDAAAPSSGEDREESVP